MLQPKNYYSPPPPAIAASLLLLVKILYRENPVEISVLEKIRESAVQLIVLLYVLQPLPHPSQLRWSYRQIKPAKYPSLGKNPPKYTTAYIVQQSNCRWHCEPTCFLRWAFNKEKSLHTLLLQSPHLLSSISNPSLYKPSVLSPLSVWLLKHKE